MKLKLHTIANGTVCLKLECENETEKGLLKLFYGSGSSDGTTRYYVNSWEFLMIETKKKMK